MFHKGVSLYSRTLNRRNCNYLNKYAEGMTVEISNLWLFGITDGNNKVQRMRWHHRFGSEIACKSWVALSRTEASWSQIIKETSVSSGRWAQCLWWWWWWWKIKTWWQRSTFCYGSSNAIDNISTSNHNAWLHTTLVWCCAEYSVSITLYRICYSST